MIKTETITWYNIPQQERSCVLDTRIMLDQGAGKMKCIGVRVIWTWPKLLRPLEWAWRRWHKNFSVEYLFEVLP